MKEQSHEKTILTRESHSNVPEYLNKDVNTYEFNNTIISFTLFR